MCSEVLCGAAHAVKPSTTPLCRPCSELLTKRCLICHKTIQNGAIKIRCVECLAIIHTGCAKKGGWTAKRCPSPACSTPIMEKEVLRGPSSCLHCQVVTVGDAGARECSSCLRDVCSGEKCTMGTQWCSRCATECGQQRESAGVYGRHMVWWGQSPDEPALPAPLNELRTRASGNNK